MKHQEMLHLAQNMQEGKEKKALTWAAMELEDRRLQIEELIEDDLSRTAECDQLRRALMQGAEQLEILGRFMRDAAFTMDSKTFSRDFAGWINLMAHHNDEDYGTNSKPRPHKDTR